MISYRGYDDLIKSIYRAGQDHVFTYWDQLTDGERVEFLDELKGVDFPLLGRLYGQRQNEGAIPDFEPAAFIPLDDNDRDLADVRSAGEDHIRRGKVAAFVVAGGQGTRLGYEGPKGKYPVAPISGSTLFRIHAEKVYASGRKYGVGIPLLVMTSEENHGETLEYFEENRYFGLDPRNVFIFRQRMIPSLDMDGKLILKNKNGIFQNPDGHGGSLTALAVTGILKTLAERGIETISYFQVDNPLVRIVDPLFIGHHILGKALVSSKTVRKAYPEEKVGIFVRLSGGRTGVVEYSDLPAEKIYMRDSSGRLMYDASNIAIHLFDRTFVESITSGGELSLPYHMARKKIRAFAAGGAVDIDGLKFEKFVFDALPLTEHNLIMETSREEEFAPVKNASGVDSVASARELMSRLHRGWLDQRGIPVPPDVRTVEISPLVALEPGDIPGDIAVIPSGDSLYIGEA